MAGIPGGFDCIHKGKRVWEMPGDKPLDDYLYIKRNLLQYGNCLVGKVVKDSWLKRLESDGIQVTKRKEKLETNKRRQLWILEVTSIRKE